MRFRRRCFPENFEKFFRPPFSQKTSGRLFRIGDIPKKKTTLKIFNEGELKYWSKKQPLDVFYEKKAVAKHFAIFTRKYLRRSVFSNKVAGLRTATLLEMRLGQKRFPVNFVKKFIETFLIEHLEWLLLKVFSCKFWGSFQSSYFSEHLWMIVFRKCVLRNFAKFTWKYMCQSLFLNKVADLTSGRLLLNFSRMVHLKRSITAKKIFGTHLGIGTKYLST